MYRDPETLKIFHFVTSDFHSRAQKIADLYRKRWSVELLFRWLKGHLKVRTLDARTPNAVKVQLTLAVLVQLLIQLYRTVTHNEDKLSLWECLRQIRTQWIRASLCLTQTPEKSEDNFLFAISPAPGAPLRPSYASS